jgi:predicted Rossmann-fold nucleotide-binding protein
MVYDPLKAMVEKMVAEGFMHARYAEMLPFSTDVESVVTYFRNYQAPASKWVKN